MPFLISGDILVRLVLKINAPCVCVCVCMCYCSRVEKSRTEAQKIYF